MHINAEKDAEEHLSQGRAQEVIGGNPGASSSGGIGPTMIRPNRGSMPER